MRKHLSCISNYFPVFAVARRNWPEAASVSVHRQHIYDYPIVAVIFATIISQTHILHPRLYMTIRLEYRTTLKKVNKYIFILSFI